MRGALLATAVGFVIGIGPALASAAPPVDPQSLGHKTVVEPSQGQAAANVLFLNRCIGGCLIKADNASAPGLGLLLDDDAAGVVDRVVDDEFLTLQVQAVSS